MSELASGERRCKNCGALAPSKFCSECGQSTAVTVPSLGGLFHEVFSAVFSYDSRMWRTLRTLVLQPGELTRQYIDCVRAPYLTPFQLFIWLQAAAFLVNRIFFDTKQSVSDAKSRDLLIVGLAVFLMLAIFGASRRRKVIESLVCTTHIWSFLMLVLLVEYAILPIVAKVISITAAHALFYEGYTATFLAIAALLIYTPLALARVYSDKWWLASLKTLLMLLLYIVLAFALERYVHPSVQV